MVRLMHVQHPPLPSWRVIFAVLAVLAVLAGCAVTPPPARDPVPAGPGRATAPARLPPVSARHPDRDGAPLAPPPDLASLPDPEPQVEAIRSGGPNKPYAVLGQSYVPSQGDAAFKQRGLASWYGTKFHGRRTASGELFSVYGLTAAHRTLPIPSYVRVRSVATGKEVIVRVNDRGPFHSTRVMDLSYAAAVKLGIVTRGPSEVELERLTFDEIRSGAWRRGTTLDPDAALASTAPDVSPVSSPAVEAAPLMDLSPEILAAPAVSALPPGSAVRAYTQSAQGFWVQLAALGRQDGVDRLQQRVAIESPDLSPLLAVFHEAPLFKLQLGPYPSRDQAQAVARQARSLLQLSPIVLERR
jgi:rare lipoprotein A